MMNYTWTIILSVLAMLVLGILLFENGRIAAEKKIRFYYSYGIIAFSAIIEWLEFYLNGAPSWTRLIHAIVIFLDYSVTPIASVCFVSIVSDLGNKRKAIIYFFGGNIVFQLISAVTGWTFYLDENNFYHHGPFFFLYAIVFVLAILFVGYEFQIYGSKFSRNNRVSMNAILILVGLGIGAQEIMHDSIRTTYLSLAFGSMLLFVHYCEFSSLENDEVSTMRKFLLEKDVLTGLFNRYAYDEMVNTYREYDKLPKNLIVFSVDINGLKRANDQKGHEAGDELIQGAAQCIQQTMESYGKCFRTGGDEFIAIVLLERDRIGEICQNLEVAAREWKGEYNEHVFLSYGYATAEEYPLLSIEKLIHVADQMMYKAKSNYYLQYGNDRRGH